MTWLGLLNRCVLQWFFVRLQKTVDTDSGRVVAWTVLRGIVPETGWRNGYGFVRVLRADPRQLLDGMIAAERAIDERVGFEPGENRTAAYHRRCCLETVRAALLGPQPAPPIEPDELVRVIRDRASVSSPG